MSIGNELRIGWSNLSLVFWVLIAWILGLILYFLILFPAPRDVIQARVIGGVLLASIAPILWIKLYSVCTIGWRFLILSPDGFIDKRFTKARIPWVDVQEMRLHENLNEFPYIVVQLDPDARISRDLQALKFRSLVMPQFSADCAMSINVSQFLNLRPKEVFNAMRLYWAASRNGDMQSSNGDHDATFARIKSCPTPDIADPDHVFVARRSVWKPAVRGCINIVVALLFCFLVARSGSEDLKPVRFIGLFATALLLIHAASLFFMTRRGGEIVIALTREGITDFRRGPEAVPWSAIDHIDRCWDHSNRLPVRKIRLYLKAQQKAEPRVKMGVFTRGLWNFIQLGPLPTVLEPAYLDVSQRELVQEAKRHLHAAREGRPPP